MAIWQWVISHQGLVSGAGVAVLDLVFALSPSVASNGALHFLYLQLKKLSGSDTVAK